MTRRQFFLSLVVPFGFFDSLTDSSVLGAADVENTTLCAVYKDPQKYVGRLVKLQARFYGGLHGRALIDETCPLQTSGGRAVAPGFDVITPKEEQRGERPVDFVLDDKSWDAFSSFFRKNNRDQGVSITLIGLVRVRKNFRLQEFGNGPAGNGYGDRGIYRLQLVVRNVERFGP